MAKPSEMYCTVDKCPKCGRPGHGVWYIPEDNSIRDRLEFVIHHGINGQIKGALKAMGRNYFHYMGVYRDAEDGEIVTSRKSRPRKRPNWCLIQKRFSSKEGE